MPRALLALCVLACGRIDYGYQEELCTRHPDLLAWFAMDELPTTEITDVSGHGNHALCGAETCPSLDQGRVGQGLRFGEGIHGRIPFDDSHNLTLGFTLVAWVSPAPGAERNVASKALGATENNSFQLVLLSDDVIRLNLGRAGGGRDFVDLPYPETGEFVPLTAVWSSDTESARLTVDDDSAEFAIGSLGWDNHDILIGADEDDGQTSGFMEGVIDELRIYRRALDETELAEVLRCGI